MYDLITIGNITIDLYFGGSSLTHSSDRFELAFGGKYAVNQFEEHIGGGGANVAIGASTHGLNTAIYSKIGNDSFRQIILQKLIKKMISTEFISTENDTTNISAILLSQKGEKTVIHYTTPQNNFDLSDTVKKNIINTRAIYMGNVYSYPFKERVKLLSYFKSHDKKIFLNIGEPDVDKEMSELSPLFHLCDVLIVNTHEYAQIVKKDYAKIDFTKNCLQPFENKNMILILTNGPYGSYLYHKDTNYFQNPYKATVKDTTGAGDAFCAGFISSYLQGMSLEESMRAASLYATKIVEKIGAN